MFNKLCLQDDQWVFLRFYIQLIHSICLKGARARTVLSEKQLNILKTCYSANPRPDALMKEQLVEMTTLSPRVIRVWFQNKRCKDKKIQLRMQEKQIQRECVSFSNSNSMLYYIESPPFNYSHDFRCEIIFKWSYTQQFIYFTQASKCISLILHVLWRYIMVTQ